MTNDNERKLRRDYEDDRSVEGNDHIIVRKEEVYPYVMRALKKFPEIKLVGIEENIVLMDGFPRLTVIFIKDCNWNTWKAFVREVKKDMPRWMRRGVLIDCPEAMK